MSAASLPRCSTWTGRAMPSRMGPIASRATDPPEQLVGDVRGVQVGEDKTLAVAASVLNGSSARNRRIAAAFRLHFTVDFKSRIAFLHTHYRLGHLVRFRMARRAEIRKRQHRNTRLDPEPSARIARSSSAISARVSASGSMFTVVSAKNISSCCRIMMYRPATCLTSGAVPITSSAGRMVSGYADVLAGDQAVGIAFVHHHAAEIRCLPHQLARLVERHALALPRREQLLCVALLAGCHRPNGPRFQCRTDRAFSACAFSRITSRGPAGPAGRCLPRQLCTAARMTVRSRPREKRCAWGPGAL